MLYAKAKQIAIEVGNAIAPYCEKINIAGSIRRQRSEVKDIELICIPKKTEMLDLFGDVVGKVIDERFTSSVKMLGKIIKGQPTGKMMQIELPEKIMLDLFIPYDFDYYRQYAIRTGSSQYSHYNIANGWLKIGWCGSDMGLRKQSDCVEHKDKAGKTHWICKNPNAEKPPVWQSEKEFFEWIKVPFLDPKYRSL